MSMLLLEKLQKKPVPKEIEKPVAIKLGSEQVDIQVQIEDQSKTSNFDVVLLKERIKRRGLAAPQIEVKVPETIADNERKGEPEEPLVVLPKEIEPPKSLTVFYASNINQLAYEHPDYKNGLFTYYLLKGLKGEADNGDKSLTISELHNYVQKNVQDTTKVLYTDLPQIPILFTSKPNRVICRLP